MVLRVARETSRLLALIWGHPANKKRKFRAIGASILWQIYKRLVGKPIDIRVYGDIVFRCHRDSQDASRMIYFNGLPDPAEMHFLERYLRPGERFLDIGGNVGVYTLFAAKIVGASGRVVAFEPDLTSSERLLENVRLNKLTWVSVKRVAISDLSGTLEFTVGADTGNSFANLAKTRGLTRVVETTTLDEATGGEQFAMCKVDVEGAEFRVLKGALSLIESRCPPVWQLELTDRTLGRSGSSVAHVQEWLRVREFDLWSYDPDFNELRPWVMRPRLPGTVGDALAIARTALPMVRQRLGIEDV